MKTQRAIGAVLIIFAVFLLAGCEKTGGKTGEKDGDVITIDLYDQAANYQGIQPGWFGKILMDKFKVRLNVITPQVAGDGKTLFQTRAASGNLGDVVILDNADFLDCIKAGLIMDISEHVHKYENLNTYDYQIKVFNANIPDNKGRIFGIPCNMTNTSPTSFNGLTAFSSPILPWDYFTEIGAPRLKNTDDLLAALEKMQKAHPKGIDGNPAYGISLWPDWDVTSNEMANQAVKWYGVEVASGYPQSSVLLDTNNKMKSLIDDNGEYRKMLKFFYNANKRGIMDPDSGTQKWDQIVDKMKNRRMFLLWYNWQPDFWNNTTKGNNRENWMPIPVEDMYFFQDGDSYFGDGRVWGLGSKVSAAKRDRILELLDWLASPEGLEFQHDGIKDFNYVTLPDGTYVRTPVGDVAYAENTPVPEEWGGGGYYDGNTWINQWVVAVAAINPNNGYPYDWKLWPAEIEKARTTTMKEWEAMYQAESQTEYLRKHNQLGVVPRANVVLPSDPTDIQLIRSQCATITKDASWKMIFAKDEAEFNKLWSDMKTQLNGFGWEKMLEYDMKKFSAVVNARIEAVANEGNSDKK
jgi:multiple sugar transport system substrate-binding protein/putative aldouronate transport system substrate-binding protein